MIGDYASGINAGMFLFAVLLGPKPLCKPALVFWGIGALLPFILVVLGRLA